MFSWHHELKGSNLCAFGLGLFFGFIGSSTRQYRFRPGLKSSGFFRGSRSESLAEGQHTPHYINKAKFFAKHKMRK